MSAIGTKQTFQLYVLMSAFGGKADIVPMSAYDPKRTRATYLGERAK